MSDLVIVGTGLAGYTVAREFRKLDSTTPLHLISRDHASFYSKPILSNALALKKSPAQIALNTAADMERQLSATISPHSTVSSLDPRNHRIVVDGSPLNYTRLVLAIGADPIRLSLAGDAADTVCSVNDLDDYAAFRGRLEGKRRLVILGAGLIGCEFANDLCASGYAVSVIELANQPLGRLLPPQSGATLRTALEAVGVDFHFGRSVQSVRHDAGALAVTLSDGTVLATDLVLSAIGLRPRLDLARAAGLTVNRGIVTNAGMQTSDTDVFALGDCAEIAGHNLPFVMPIMQAARALARTLSGTPTPVHYPAMPVVVKTPACPTVVCPPPAGIEGHWQEAVTADGVQARFLDTQGALRGFALLGTAVKDRQALSKEIPPLLA